MFMQVVALGDKLHRIKVKPGPEGQREFKDKIRMLFNIPDNMDFDVSFRCKAPCTDRNLTGGGEGSELTCACCTCLHDRNGMTMTKCKPVLALHR